ncbi:NUDIX hydrolase N-terminal domain-containing protein [Halobium palmae]|uniref:NUDIX hydrolase N-terminal domain-containing protein n=1 Tax=Halobium palmae TaxID=1776492 RepID=A0ABD5RZX7_9EURY
MNTVALLDELRTLAENGLAHSTDPYDRERYRRVLDLVAAEYADLAGLPTAEVRERFAAELGHVTPKVGADAAVFDDDGALLLLRRTDTGRWCLPGGWVDPGESPAEAAVRETREETGLRVRPVELVDSYSLPAGPESGPHGQVSLVYRCAVEGGTLALSREGTELRYRQIPEVDDWFTIHREFATDAYRTWRRSTDAN